MGGSLLLVGEVPPLAGHLFEGAGLIGAAIALSAPLRRGHGVAVDVLPRVPLLSAAALEVGVFDLRLVVGLEQLLELAHATNDGHVGDLVGVLEAVEELEVRVVLLGLELGEVEPVLVVVHHLQGIVVDGHEAVLGVFVGVGGEAGRDEVVGGELLLVGEGGEEAHVVAVGVPVELPADVVGVALGQCVEPHRPVVHGRGGRDVPDHVYELPRSLGGLELGLDPLQHASGVGGVAQVVPVLVVLRLRVDGDDLEVVELGDHEGVVPLCPEHLVGGGSEPGLPGLRESPVERAFAGALVVVDVDGEALVVAHGGDDLGVGGPGDLLGEHDGEVEVVALGLLPDVVRRVVARPDDQVRLQRRHLLQEQLERLDRQVALVQTPPEPRRRIAHQLRHLQVLPTLHALQDLTRSELESDVGAAADGLAALAGRTHCVVQVGMEVGDVESLEHPAPSGLLPLLVGLVGQDLLDLLVHIADLVLLGAEAEVVAGGVRVGVVAPEGVDNGVHHLVDCALADVVVLQLLPRAVGGGDGVQGQLGGFGGDRPLVLPDDRVAQRADRVDRAHLSRHGHQQQHSRNCNHSPHNQQQILSLPVHSVHLRKDQISRIGYWVQLWEYN